MMSNAVSFTELAHTNDPQIADILQQLIDWHSSRVAALQQVLDIPPEKGIEIVIGGKKIKADPQMMLFLKLGIETALAQFGKLPISLTPDSDDDEEEGD